MSEYTNCVRCQRQFLVATAAKNGGLCGKCLKEPEEIRSHAILSFLAAGGMVLLGLVAFFWFRTLESEGGQIRTHMLIVVAYRTLGSFGVLGLFLLFSAGAGINGLLKLWQSRQRAEEVDRLQQTADVAR